MAEIVTLKMTVDEAFSLLAACTTVITATEVHGVKDKEDLPHVSRLKAVTGRLEVEYTRAAYGCIDNRGKVRDTNPVGVTQLLLAAYYYF